MTGGPPRLHVLGSGSTGNTAIVDLDGGDRGTRHVLIDLGLGPRTLVRRAAAAGLDFDPDHVVAALVTHPDQDHLRPSWAATLARRGWPVHALPGHHPAMARHGVPAACLRPLADRGRSVEVIDGLRVAAAVAPHDDHGTAALRLSIGDEDRELVLGWATDLGRVTPEVRSLLEGCDALGIESNYDPGLQADSPRPPFLKQRITGGHGHLSNRECLEAVVALAASRMPRSITLLHLSQECNHPELLRGLWRTSAPHLEARMRIAHAVEPVVEIPLGPGEPVRSDTEVACGEIASTLFG